MIAVRLRRFVLLFPKPTHAIHFPFVKILHSGAYAVSAGVIACVCRDGISCIVMPFGWANRRRSAICRIYQTFV